MKLSLYNWIVEHKEDVIAYNGFTGAMALLKPENVNSIRHLFSLDGRLDSYLDEMDENVRDALNHGGFVIEDKLEERALLRIAFNARKFGGPKEFSGLTLVMTRRCNFRCSYCFEHKTLNTEDSITDEVIERIVDIAETGTGKLFSITLYGGEPLLEIRKCIDVCRRCKNVLEERGAKFSATMVSNGYLLTPKIAGELKKNGVKKIQITVDGSKETHNANRPLKNGGGTYDKIINNIETCAGKINIQIRMNTKSVKLNEINELKERMSPYPTVNVYVAPVDLSCQGNSDFYTIVKNELAEVLPVEQMKLHDIYSRIGGCTATALRPSVVLPNGNLVRCWEQLEDGESSCTIFDDSIVEDRVSVSRWLAWDPYLPGNRCYQCSYLPGCGGGCPRKPVINGKERCLYCSDEEYKKSIIGSYISLQETKNMKSASGEN